MYGIAVMLERKERKKDRTSGGFIIGKRKGWENKEDRLISKE